MSQPVSRDSSASALACSSVTCVCCAIAASLLAGRQWGVSTPCAARHHGQLQTGADKRCVRRPARGPPP
ncbi:hypothetical protein I549_5633 [Mycobacterium avium subsp. avium 2285 (R)]|nr:hypothetical protein I549_5633 [Mycobacterium avium subsp. avium 2285 (R)]